MNVPDRWFNYSSFNKPIGNTRIIAIKTPLKQNFNTGLTNEEMCQKNIDGVPLDKEFTPTQLIEKLGSKGLKLSHVIDLTNTRRYYDFDTFTKQGICYDKIFCPGHEIPPDLLYRKFTEIISNFISATTAATTATTTTDIIAVHCTHGVNRTGYFVCRYLIEYCGYQPDTAIKCFNEARGHEIERSNYIDQLRQCIPNSAYTSSTKVVSPVLRSSDKTYYREERRERRRPLINNRDRSPVRHREERYYDGRLTTKEDRYVDCRKRDYDDRYYREYNSHDSYYYYNDRYSSPYRIDYRRPKDKDNGHVQSYDYNNWCPSFYSRNYRSYDSRQKL